MGAKVSQKEFDAGSYSSIEGSCREILSQVSSTFRVLLASPSAGSTCCPHEVRILTRSWNLELQSALHALAFGTRANDGLLARMLPTPRAAAAASHPATRSAQGVLVVGWDALAWRALVSRGVPA